MAGKECALSVLFADVSGSSRLYEKLGDTEALHAVDRCIKRMERAVEAFRGRIVKSGGDEIMAVFDADEDAFQAASEMQQRIADLPPVSGVKLAIRIGFHHGPVSEESGDYSGETVNAAARLAGLAKPGQVLTSGETVARLPELFSLATRSLDARGLKGAGKENAKDAAKGAPAGSGRIFEVLWQEGEAGAGPAPAAAGVVELAGLSAAAAGGRLCLRYGGEVLVVDDKCTSLDLGRDANCDLVIHDRRASRKHGRIEHRGGQFVLTDMSTNGTYVTFAGEPEYFLRRQDLVLRGSGRLSFAASGNSDGADVAEFEHL